MNIVALVTCTNKNEYLGGTELTFAAMYKEGENTWAEATPSLTLKMVVKKSVAEKFQVGVRYNLNFSPVAE